jgi:hypothetical protein
MLTKRIQFFLSAQRDDPSRFDLLAVNTAVAAVTTVAV